MSEIKDRTLGIIGSGGYIGRNLMSFLNENGMAYDIIGGDVTDPCFMDGEDVGRYKAIYYLAGLTGTEDSFAHPEEFLAVNAFGLVNICRAISRYKADKPKIIFPSSRLVYRGGVRLVEDSPLEARSVYAASKIAGEALLTAYYHRFGVPYCSLRIGQVCGNVADGCTPRGVYAMFERQAGDGGRVMVYGDGSAIRTWTHIGSVCSIMIRVAEDDVPSGVYNVGGSDASISDMASSVAKRLKAEVCHCEWPVGAMAIETGDATLDGSRLCRVIANGKEPVHG